jgi:hypothetical protein
MAARRTADEIRAEIETERNELATAVEYLRGSLGEATNVTKKVASRLPVVAAGAGAAGFVIAGGLGATIRLITGRGREEQERARLGRFRLLDRG